MKKISFLFFVVAFGFYLFPSDSHTQGRRSYYYNYNVYESPPPAQTLMKFSMNQRNGVYAASQSDLSGNNHGATPISRSTYPVLSYQKAANNYAIDFRNDGQPGIRDQNAFMEVSGRFSIPYKTFTLEMWVQPRSISNANSAQGFIPCRTNCDPNKRQVLFAAGPVDGNGSPTGVSFALALDSQLRPSYYSSASAAPYDWKTIGVPAGLTADSSGPKAFHLAITFGHCDNNNQCEVKFFINGNPVGSYRDVLPPTVLNNLYAKIAAWPLAYNRGYQNRYYFHGFLDDVALYDYIRNDDAIKSDANSSAGNISFLGAASSGGSNQIWEKPLVGNIGEYPSNPPPPNPTLTDNINGMQPANVTVPTEVCLQGTDNRFKNMSTQRNDKQIWIGLQTGNCSYDNFHIALRPDLNTTPRGVTGRRFNEQIIFSLTSVNSTDVGFLDVGVANPMTLSTQRTGANNDQFDCMALPSGDYNSVVFICEPIVEDPAGIPIAQVAHEGGFDMGRYASTGMHYLYDGSAIILPVPSQYRQR